MSYFETLRSAWGLRGGGVLPKIGCFHHAVLAVFFALALPSPAIATDCDATCPPKSVASLRGPDSTSEGTAKIVFTVNLSAPRDTDTNIDFDAYGSTSVESDYAPVTGRFVIPAGETEGVIEIELVDDDVVERPETLTIIITPTDEADVDEYASTLTTVITDNDIVGLDLHSGSLEVSEDGTSQTGEFSLVLTAEPPGEVIITFTPDDKTEVRTDVTTATFTEENWNQPQNIVVRGVPDNVKDGDQTSNVKLAMSAPALVVPDSLPSVEVTTHDAEGSTLTSKGEPQQFRDATRRYMADRLHVIAGNETGGFRLVRRGKGKTGSNTINVAGENGNVEGNFAVSAQGVVSALDRRKANIVATADLPNTEELVSDWNLWSEGQFGFYQNKGGVVDTKGDFFVGYLGLDYRIGENTVAGVMGEFDWMESREQGSINEIDGNGFLVGPYISSEIASNIFFDARALWGLSDNDATQDVGGTVFTGDFQTERILLEAKLAGQHDIESLRITPEVAVLYTSDDQSAYTISGGGGTVLVPGQTVDLGRASAGLTLTHLGQMGDYSFEPFIGGKLNWDFENPDAASNDLKAALSVGFILKSNDLEFGAQAIWDGVGADSYQAAQGVLSLKFNL